MQCGETPRGCPEGMLGKCGVRPGPLLGFAASQSWELLPSSNRAIIAARIPGIASCFHPSAVTLRLALWGHSSLPLLGPLGSESLGVPQTTARQIQRRQVRGQGGGYSQTVKRTTWPGRADRWSGLSERTQGAGWLGISQGSHRGWGQTVIPGVEQGGDGVVFAQGSVFCDWSAEYTLCLLEKPFKASTFISTDGCAAGWLPGMRLWGR